MDPLTKLDKAKAYEKAYAAQNAQLSPWRCNWVVNGKNWAGLPATPFKGALLSMPVADVPMMGWVMFKEVATRTDPTGWEAECTPRDKDLAGFKAVVVTADSQKVKEVKYKTGWF